MGALERLLDGMWHDCLHDWVSLQCLFDLFIFYCSFLSRLCRCTLVYVVHWWHFCSSGTGNVQVGPVGQLNVGDDQIPDLSEPLRETLPDPIRKRHLLQHGLGFGHALQRKLDLEDEQLDKRVVLLAGERQLLLLFRAFKRVLRI